MLAVAAHRAIKLVKDAVTFIQVTQLHGEEMGAGAQTDASQADRRGGSRQVSDVRGQTRAGKNNLSSGDSRT